MGGHDGGAVLVGCVGHRRGQRRGLQSLTHDVHLAQFLRSELGDRVAEVTAVSDESLADQRLQCLTHRDLAHTEQVGDLCQWNRRARQDGTVEDHAAQLVEDRLL